MAQPAKVTKVTKPGGKDIRMFFGATSGSQKTATQTSGSGSQPRDAIEISDDDSIWMKAAAAKSVPRTQGTSKPSKVAPMVVSDDEAPKKSVAPKRKKVVDSDEESDEAQGSPPKKKKTVAASKPSKANHGVLLSSDSEEEPAKSPKKKQAAVATKPSAAKPKPRVSEAKKPRASTSKRKSKKDEDFIADSDEESDMESPSSGADELLAPKAPSKKPAKRATAKAKVEEKPATKGTTKEKEKEKDQQVSKPKFNWAAAKAAKLAGPVAPGSKEVPDGAPDALAGLSFVFTGELSSFSREEAVDLAKRFGGRVVGQPSSKTDYVVLGDNAGPSKLAAIKKHGIRTVNEDEFLNLIGTRKGLGNGNIDEKTKKKMEKEQEAIRQAAREMEKREEKEKKAAAKGTKTVDPSSQLWTTRYAPQSIKDICGNKTQVEKLQQWLHDWQDSKNSGFKKPGKHGMNIYRAVLITGPPGIGKTTSAHMCARLEGYTPIELNASDTRSKKLVENGMNINNTSLDGYIKGTHDALAAGVPFTDRTCLIMDEVDGMSAGDRGGVGALNALIKKTKIPIICIANDRQAQKLKPLMATTYNMSFSRPQAAAVRSRILTIAFKEKMKIPANVIDQLITSSQSDIRQVLNMLSTWKLSSDTMNFDEAKTLAKMNEKYSIMSPFDITSKMLGPYLFSATSRETLGDKMELYFQDHSFIPLFIQENYLKTQPAKLRDLEGPEKTLKQLELMDCAASSISDGDLVDAQIHGPEQHWGLMPLHAVCSAVRPASFLYGTGAHYGGPGAMSFPQWLGQNSKLGKLSRQLTDVQIRMRLKVSGDKAEIRQSYIPALFPHIVKPLMDEGTSAVDEVIERMDEYYLSKEDWDTVVELGVDEQRDEVVMKKISSATKSALTRKYNGSEHPIPFHKALDIGKPKKLAAGPAPDLEEAFDMDEVVDELSDEEKKSNSDDVDVTTDKLIQVAKKKKAPAKNGKAKK
ncbi:putative replication factor C subunit 1 [Lyophyllum shimeji]|uniref:Replication factor C subunit 1 n=1 Tax=Lyophyllum shimeji TaxID=47721 RepID=A0A9P3PCQ5_LYOSH|nr:putative replication factor C subunit 1 [Lyophyllum shimeji]